MILADAPDAARAHGTAHTEPQSYMLSKAYQENAMPAPINVSLAKSPRVYRLAQPLR